MIELIVYALVVFGIAYGIGHTKLTYGFRKWLSHGNAAQVWLLLLLECVFCVSFHLGWLAVYFKVAPFFDRDLRGGLECAFFSAATSLILGRTAGLLDHD